MYSDVSDTLRVVLLDTNGDKDININETLVAKGIAVPIQEGYQSKVIHDNVYYNVYHRVAKFSFFVCFLFSRFSFFFL